MEWLGFPWWSLILMVCGVLAIFTLILNLFSDYGARPSEAEQVGSCEVGSIDFLLALSGVINAPLHRGGTAKLLNNGDEFFPPMLESIRGAERSVNFLVYIWEDGEVSDSFFAALTETARRGVPVRVLVDGFGSMKAPKSKVEAFQAAGGRWERFHTPRFGTLTRLHRRTHRRALVIDGLIGYTGGAAVMDKWLGHAQDPDHWRDTMTEVRGRLALSLQSAFTQLWAQTTGELLSGEAFYPPNAHEAETDDEAELVRRHVNIISSPSDEAHPLRHVFWLSMRSARKRLFITNPYFLPDDTVRLVLRERAEKGVDVRLLVPNEHNDIAVLRWASRSYYEKLLASGVRIYEYQPTMIHQKLLVVDGKWSLVGSVNMDIRSKELNQENALGILDEGFGVELEKTFFADLERAQEVKLEEWRKRPTWVRGRDYFFRLFEEQF